MERKKRSWVSWGMALLLALNLLVPIGTVYAEGTGTTIPVKNSDETTGAVLTVQSLEVKQGTKIINPNDPDDKITSTENISIAVSFGVPVEGDGKDSVTPVHYGDTATFVLSNSFQFAPDSVPKSIELIDSSTSEKLGTVTLSNNS